MSVVEELKESEVPKEQQIRDALEMMDSIELCMMTTLHDGNKLNSRAMRIQKREGLDLWFVTDVHSGKVKDLNARPDVNLAFLQKDTQEWISVSGKCIQVTDPEKIKELYTEDLHAWFPDKGDGIHDGGPQDPRLVLLKVTLDSIVYQMKLPGQSMAGQMFEVVKGTVMGSAPKVGSIREISDQELNAFRTMAKVEP